MLRKSKNFISMPVVSLEDGQEIGSIKGLVINPEKRVIAALVIDQKGWFKEQRVIPYVKVHSVGDDAITVEKSNSAAKWTSLSEVVQLVNQKIDLVGAKVVTEKGTVLGFVNEYFVDETTGEIIALDISGKLIESLVKGRGQLPMPAIRTIGKDALIAYEGAEDQLVKMDGGFKDTLSSIKETTSHLWENTWQKTKELSKNLPLVGGKETDKAVDDLIESTEEDFEEKPCEKPPAPVAEVKVEAPPPAEQAPAGVEAVTEDAPATKNTPTAVQEEAPSTAGEEDASTAVNVPEPVDETGQEISADASEAASLEEAKTEASESDEKNE